MSYDFKSLQVRLNKIIASGSTGTNAAMLIYPVSASTDLLGGTIFDSTGIGTDVFLFVSGSALSGLQKSVFGGDVHISGNLTIDGSGGGGGDGAVAGAGMGWHLADPAPLGLWDLNGHGLDSSGNDNHLTPKSAMTYYRASDGGAGFGGFYEATNALTASRQAAGFTNHRYDGDSIEDGNMGLLQRTGSLSVIVWMRPTNISGFHTIVVFDNAVHLGGGGEPDGINNHLWTLGFNDGKCLYRHHSGAAGTNHAFTNSEVSLVANEWCHAAFTRAENGRNISFYKNGHLVTTTTMSNGPTGGISSSLSIGDWKSELGTFSGRACGVAVYDTELTHEQIFADYRAQRRGLINYE